METVLAIAITIIVALIVGAVAVFFGLKRIEIEKRSILQEELDKRDVEIGELEEKTARSIENREAVILANAELEGERKKVSEIRDELKITDSKEAVLVSRNTELEKQIASLKATLETERAARKELNESVERTEKHFKNAFENLSNKIFEDKSEKFEKRSKEGLEIFLNPLKKEIEDFKEKFAKTDKGFAEKFGELKNQVEGLSKLNQTIGTEAQNLTKALKGDSKGQGNWGEFMLEKALEMSGLREGREYESQKSISDEDGGRRILDVVVHLPDNKDIVIDSKVSLDDYADYCSSENEEKRTFFLRKHKDSVERHIRDLSEKRYQNLPGVRTLNFVLMFIPVEPAYILTVNQDQDIFQKALGKNVVLVCPSTLLAVLKTVHSLWRMEDRNSNAQEIAEEAGKLYDKFAGFVVQMEKVDKQLGTARNTFDSAYNSLSKGRGNILRRAENMKRLGAKTSRSLPPLLVEDSYADDNPIEQNHTEEVVQISNERS